MIYDQSSRIVGIDPGAKGALAFMRRDTEGKLSQIDIRDMPMHKKNGYHLIDLDTLALTLKGWLHIDLALIEEPFSVPPPTQYVGLERRKPITSAVSTKASYVNYGRLQGILEAMRTTWGYVTPSAWKAKMGLTDNKDFSRETAQHKFPMVRDVLKLKKHDGRAEALLLAEYAHYHVWLPAEMDRQRGRKVAFR